MMWTDKTHVYAATDCKYLGKPCPAAQRMVAKLAEALSAAKPLTEDDFEIAGSTRLEGCPRACPAQFVASHERIRIYAGVEDSAPRAELDRFADAILGPSATANAAAGLVTAGLVAATLKTRPCALVEALPKTTAQPASQPAQHL